MYAIRSYYVLEKLSGLVVGQFTDMKDNETPFGESIEEIILNSVAEYSYPQVFQNQADRWVESTLKVPKQRGKPPKRPYNFV